MPVRRQQTEEEAALILAGKCLKDRCECWLAPSSAPYSSLLPNKRGRCLNGHATGVPWPERGTRLCPLRDTEVWPLLRKEDHDLP
jgi:hypothetical protein